MVKPDNPELYEKAKAIADEKYAKPSAYKSGFIVKMYKQMGGTYSGGKSKELTKQIKKVKGDGLLDSLKGAFNQVTDTIVDTGKQAVGAVSDKAKQFGNTLSQVITGSTDYSPSVRKILDTEGNNLIKSIVVGRTPVQQAITMALNAVSQGQFQSNQDRLNYDKLFHLFSEITLENGKQVRVEKNEVITMTMGFKQDADTERQEVPMTKAVSFRDLLENARRKMKQKFFAYDSANNNCQDFIMALIQASGLGTQENFEFIKQNTKQLFEKIPRTRALAKQITNLGQRINIAMAGGKISSKGMPKFAKGSQEARDHMARIRAMRGRGKRKEDSESDSDEEDRVKGRGTGKDLGKNLGSNLGRLADSGTDKLISMMGTGTGKDLGKNLGSNLGRLADSGTDKLISMMGTGTGKDLGKNLGSNLGRLADSGTDKLISMMGTGTHIHHHHYHPQSYKEGGNLSFSNAGPAGGTIYYSNAGGRGYNPNNIPARSTGGSASYGHHNAIGTGTFDANKPYKNSYVSGEGVADDIIKKLGIKMPTNAKEAVQQAQILHSLTPAGMAMTQVKKMMGRGGPKGLASFNKWTKAIGDFLKPVAKPILEAGTRQAVKNIDAYGSANARQADPFGSIMGQGGPKGLASFNKWTKSIGDFLKPVAKPILQAGTRQAVKNIDAYGSANADAADPYGAIMGRGKRFAKGSPEAKAHMAKIRAMRKK